MFNLTNKKDVGYTLLVIDMQENFTASLNGKTVRSCAREIKHAMKHKYPVVFAEFEGFGYTHKHLKYLVRDYDRTFTFLKSRESGAPEFEKVINHFRFPRNIRVCGVNTDQCVLSTVRDLSSGVFNTGTLTVVKSACNTDTDRSGNDFAFAAMESLNGVTLI